MDHTSQDYIAEEGLFAQLAISVSFVSLVWFNSCCLFVCL